jgi:hypothetical protein
MRSSYLVLCVVVCVSACVHQIEVSSSTSKRWENRDVSELITAIGPYDKTLIQGDSRTYDWYRFSNCLVTAHTSREEKILKIDVVGTTQGCNVYLQKMGDGEPPGAKR